MCPREALTLSTYSVPSHRPEARTSPNPTVYVYVQQWDHESMKTSMGTLQPGDLVDPDPSSDTHGSDG